MTIITLLFDHPVLTGVLALIAAHVALHVFDRLVPPKADKTERTDNNGASYVPNVQHSWNH